MDCIFFCLMICLWCCLICVNCVLILCIFLWIWCLFIFSLDLLGFFELIFFLSFDKEIFCLLSFGNRYLYCVYVICSFFFLDFVCMVNMFKINCVWLIICVLIVLEILCIWVVLSLLLNIIMFVLCIFIKVVSFFSLLELMNDVWFICFNFWINLFIILLFVVLVKLCSLFMEF